MKEKIARFFYGRNGFDDLSRFCIWAALFFTVLSWISGIFSIIAIGLLIYSYWRAMSKNLYKRGGENNAYLVKKNEFMSRFRGAKLRFSQRKEYKFFRCPSCKTILRVPRGKGKLILTCKRCGNRFEGKS